MPRAARKKSSTGIYHVMLRGADRRIIFSDNEDCSRFVETLRRVKLDSGFRMFAYCLMGNHVHLLIKEEREPVDMIFRRLGASYVYYYNWKYQLHGHLFQDRYRSEPVENDAYFLDVLRYICQNPVKAGLSQSPFEYDWLGCSGIHVFNDLLDEIGEFTDMSGAELEKFVSEPCGSEHLEDIGPARLTDKEAAERLCEHCGCQAVQDIGGWPVEKRDEAIIKGINAGLSIRQLSRLTGISKAVIERVCA